MLKILISGKESYDSEADEFIYLPETLITMEHSLFAIAKWESKHHIPFWNPLDKEGLRGVKLLDYFICMTTTPNVDNTIYQYLSREEINQILEYMNDSMTATTISNQNKRSPSRKPMTSEEIYAVMVELGIPFECQYWNVNRLLMLIAVLQERSKPSKKQSPKETLSSYSALNKQRRAMMHSMG